MSVNPDINPAGWADPDDEDYGDEVRAGRPMPPPPFLPPDTTGPYTNMVEAAQEQHGQLVEMMDGFREILKNSILGDLTKTWATPELQSIADAFPDHNKAVREILRLRAELEAKS